MPGGVRGGSRETPAYSIPQRSRLEADSKCNSDKHENSPLGEKKRLVGEGVPCGRIRLPEDHAGAAVFLWPPATATMSSPRR